MGEVANRMSGGSFRGGREDIYLFGTMITGILLIGLGFALGYRKIRKTGTAAQSLTRLPVLIEAVGRAVSNETETINRNMDAIMLKLTALQVKIDDFRDQNDRENKAVKGMQLFAPKDTTKFYLIFSGSPVPAGLAKVMQDKLPWKSAAVKTLLLPSPITDITPLPDQLPPNTLYRHLSSRSATGAVINGCWTGRLLARAGYVPLLQVMCLWYMCFCAEVFFSVLTLYSPMEHSLGVKIFFLLSFLM